MPKSVWDTVLKAAPDAQRAVGYFAKFKAAAPAAVKRASAEQARIVAAVFSGSQFLSETLLAHPEWLAQCLNPEALKFPRQAQGLRREADALLRPRLQARDHAGALAALRQFHRREMLRIAARDLARLGNLAEITLELSHLADVCLEGVYRVCWEQLTARLGRPFHQDDAGAWQPTAFAVIGLGKLGGQELNYSSDVDVMFVYADEGHVFREPPRAAAATGRGATSHQFFRRLAEAIIAEVSRLTPEGMLFRIDLRLRPEGDAGPLARSLESCENFYAQWGQTWERMMLMKARGVAGDKALAAGFIEMVQPFRYPRSLSNGTLREIAAMKQRIEDEIVRAGELEREVKRGPGGIREIEFVAQSLQLLHGGRTPFLQGAQTVPALRHLVRYKLLAEEEAEKLAAAYGFLRDVEHRLQMENNEQTHTIPAERKARERLAALMGFASLKEFEAAHTAHRRFVRGVYERILKGDGAEPVGKALPDFERDEEQWRKLLAEHSFKDVERSARLVREFALGPGYVHVSTRTTDLARQLLPRLLEMCPRGGKAEGGKRKAENPPLPPPRRGTASGAASILRKAKLPSSEGPGVGSPVDKVSVDTVRDVPRTEFTLSDPDRVLARLDTFISAYGARAALYETWTHNPNLFRLLLLLFDRSEFLAEVAIRTPDLVDDLELSGRLRRSKSAGEILTDLRHGLRDDDQKLWLRRYHQAELMRIALREILGLADLEQNRIEFSALARACLAYALEVTLRKRKFKPAPLAILGLGKLGGDELTYGSDLDLVFVADPKVEKLADLQKIAVDVMALLSGRTEAGVVFATDARLRPDGEKGLLVNSLPAYEAYLRQRAQLWELQALMRSTFVAGNAAVGAQFQTMMAGLADFSRPRKDIAAYSPAWRDEVHRMRQRIEKERTPTGKERLAFKTGAGGLIDAEFVAQTLCLAHGWHEPNTLRALERARDHGALPKGDADALLANYRQLRRVEGILRRWSIKGEAELPDDPPAQYRVAVRCGFTSAAEFLDAMDRWRAEVRRVYRTVLGPKA